MKTTLRKGTNDVKSIEILQEVGVVAEVYCDGLFETYAMLDQNDLKAINCCVKNFHIIHDSL